MYKNSTVIHQKFGRGTVKSITDGSSCRFIKVHFKNKDVQFLFPDAFEKHLRFEDEKLQNAVLRELNGEAGLQPSGGQNLTADSSFSGGQAPKAAKGRPKQSKKDSPAKTGIYILNFQGPSSYDELLWVYEDCNKKTNLEELIEGAETGVLGWSVPAYAEIGDTILFMLASSSTDTYHLNGAVNEAAELLDWEVHDFGMMEREKFKKYAGKIICIGRIKNFPQEDGANEEYNQRLIYADIDDLHMLRNPVPLKDFRDFIKINRFGSVTGIKKDQWDKLKEVLLKKNPDLQF